jgi:hypothetical protein
MDTTAAASPQEGSFARSTRLAKPQENYVAGILLLLVVVFLWTASNFVTQVSLTHMFDVRGWKC